ncbi:acyl esterase [Fusarium agapanthi]|uniref:Acyl esterase n=1 Tax=Fusarium agapanthi TaxID=1803897 RepID=A0A9P5BDB6_9HYPO|nr:acyl esterase [Fusarium agapanthi]
MQRKFLDYFLFDKKDNGMLETLYREDETSFPPFDTQEVSFYLTPEKRLSLKYPAGEKQELSYQGFRDNITFILESPFAEYFEILGSPYLDLEVRTGAEDLDLFIYRRAIDENGKTVVLKGNHGEPMDSFTRGCFRLSHRDEVAKDFDKVRVICQPPTPKSGVVPGQIYRVIASAHTGLNMFARLGHV